MTSGQRQMTNQTPDESPGRRPGDGIRTVTSSAFSELVLDGDGPVVVEFTSYGCAYCHVFGPVLQQVAEIVKSEKRIFRVKVEVERELAGSYEILSTPTLVMFLNGQEVGRVEGPNPTVPSVLAAMTQAFGS
jgi:thioredoxin 1